MGDGVADPLIQLCRRIEKRSGQSIPTPNPAGPTTRAHVMFVLRDPGATAESGANETGFLDPYLNRDPTSARQRAALERAGIDRGICVWWNASPFHLGYKGLLRPEDERVGASCLREAVGLCPDLRVVVAMGPPAQAVCDRVWSGGDAGLPPLLHAPHPMIYGRGWEERRALLDERLAEAAQIAGAARRRRAALQGRPRP